MRKSLGKKIQSLGVEKFGEIIVQKMLIEQMGSRQLVYYWFQTNTRVSHNVNINRYHLTLHALEQDTTHDLFIRPIIELRKGDSIAKAEKVLDQFVREMNSELLKYLENNQK